MFFVCLVCLFDCTALCSGGFIGFIKKTCIVLYCIVLKDKTTNIHIDFWPSNVLPRVNSLAFLNPTTFINP